MLRLPECNHLPFAIRMSKLKGSAEPLQGKAKDARVAAAKGGAAKAKAPRTKAATKPRKAAAAVVDDTDDEGEADNAQHYDEVLPCSFPAALCWISCAVLAVLTACQCCAIPGGLLQWSSRLCA